MSNVVNPFRLMKPGTFLVEVNPHHEDVVERIFFRNSDGSIWDSYDETSEGLHVYDDYFKEYIADQDVIREAVLPPLVTYQMLNFGEIFYSPVYKKIFSKEYSSTAICVEDEQEVEFISSAQVIRVQNISAKTKERSVMSSNTVSSAVNASTPLFKTEDYFRQVDRCVYDFMSGVLGVRREHDGGYSVFSPPAAKNGKPTLKKVELNELGQSFPAIALRTKIDKLKQGDVVILKDTTNAEKWIYYLNHTRESISNYEITGIDSETGTKLSINVADGMLLSGDSVLSVKNFLGDKNGMKKMLPFLLMSGSIDQNTLLMLMMSENSENSMLPLLLMSQQNSNQQMNPLVLMMLLNKDQDIDMKKMLPFLLMSQNGQQMNPLVMMMLMNDGEMDEKTLMMMALMSNGDNTQMNPLALMMIMGENSPFSTKSTPVPAEVVKS